MSTTENIIRSNLVPGKIYKLKCILYFGIHSIPTHTNLVFLYDKIRIKNTFFDTDPVHEHEVLDLYFLYKSEIVHLLEFNKFHYFPNHENYFEEIY